VTAPVILPGRTPDGPLVQPAGSAEPVTDGGGDRLVLVSPAVFLARPSAVLLAAQQLSDEADRDPHRSRGIGPSAVDRRRRRQHALVVQRRADRSGPACS
jgi:hypothetical protein